MSGCQSWIYKKLNMKNLCLTYCFRDDSWKPWTERSTIILRNQSWIFFGKDRKSLKAIPMFSHLIWRLAHGKNGAGKDWRQGRGMIGWMVWTNAGLHGHEFEQTQLVKSMREAPFSSPMGLQKSQTEWVTELSWTLGELKSLVTSLYVANT